MTVGENTADVGGVAIAYDAFKMTKQGQDSALIGGFTPDQRFFLSVARIWRVKMKDAFLQLWINNNPHSPPMWRVSGPLMNSTHFTTPSIYNPVIKCTWLIHRGSTSGSVIPVFVAKTIACCPIAAGLCACAKGFR